MAMRMVTLSACSNLSDHEVAAAGPCSLCTATSTANSTPSPPLWRVSMQRPRASSSPPPAPASRSSRVTSAEVMDSSRSSGSPSMVMRPAST